MRSRGASVNPRVPLWTIRASGAALAFGALALADRLGFADVTGFPPLLARLGALVLGGLIAPTVYGGFLWLIMGVLTSLTMLIAFTPVVQPFAVHFVRSDSSNQPVDAVVVLSGSMNDSGLLNGAVIDRLFSGIGEARRRNVSTLALSVIEEGAPEHHITSAADQQRLMSLLAPNLTVQYVRHVASTRDEALMFAALARTNGWHRVALVTSPLHTNRACRTFEVAGLPVSCVPAEPRDYTLTSLRGANARLNAFRDVLYETMATTLYRVRGWI